MLACFLCQLYQDTFDAAVQRHDKLINKIYIKASKKIDAYMKVRRKHTRSSLAHYRTILGVLLDEDIGQEDIRDAVFTAVDVQTLKSERDVIEEMLGNNYSDSFKRVVARHSYLRQFAPALIKHITFQVDTQDNTASDIMEAVYLLTHTNDEGRHTLPKDAPMGFIPRKLRSFVLQGDKIHKPAWECTLLTVLRDQVKSGNLYVPRSKRFATLETFFTLLHARSRSERTASAACVRGVGNSHGACQ